jgi:hypothetical protein
MAKQNIRSEAINWFHSKYPVGSEPVITSKFYSPQESWSNSRVWFFQIPTEFIEPKANKYLHFICENHMKGEPFIYLKVPTLFLLKNEKSFEVDPKQKVMRIYLSGEAVDMFKEVRKGSKIDFRPFII